MELYEFSAKELARVKRRLNRRHSLFETYSGKQPLGILLGGQPASGKTRLFEFIQQDNPDIDFIEINGDEYRQYHPRATEINEEYGQDAPKYTQSFSNALVEYLKAECLRLRRNFIIEGTMRSYNVIERTAREVKKAGFRCEAHALAISRQDSLLGIFLRFERDKQRTGVGRFSPIEVHDEAYRQIPLNLAKASTEQLFHRISVYIRKPDGQLQIGIDQAGYPAEAIDFIAAFEQLRQPIFAKSFYYEQWLALGELARQRGETNEVYLNQITEFVQQHR